jgi:hypothetical protein
LAAIAAVVVFVVSTEVLDRYSRTVRRFEEILSRESATVAPESLAIHRALLKAKTNALRTELGQASGAYTRNLAGFLSLASATARTYKLKLVTVAPVRNDESGSAGELRFKIGCRGEFHQVALFLNVLENSPLDIHITKVELSAGEPPARGLESTMEGRIKVSEGPSGLFASARKQGNE